MEKHVIPILWPQSTDGAVASDIVSLALYNCCDIYLTLGGTIGQAAAVTLHKGASTSAAATALAFTRYYSSGFVLDYDGASTTVPASAGETVTGNGGGVGYVYRDTGDRLYCYAYNGTTFVDDEALTFSGGKTAVANGVQTQTDIMIPRTASGNTFNITTTTNQVYMIPVTGDMLGDGFSSVELNLGDANTTLFSAHAVLYSPRYIMEVMPSAI